MFIYHILSLTVPLHEEFVLDPTAPSVLALSSMYLREQDAQAVITHARPQDEAESEG